VLALLVPAGPGTIPHHPLRWLNFDILGSNQAPTYPQPRHPDQHLSHQLRRKIRVFDSEGSLQKVHLLLT
jgi:hypothetical protein